MNKFELSPFFCLVLANFWGSSCSIIAGVAVTMRHGNSADETGPASDPDDLS